MQQRRDVSDLPRALVTDRDTLRQRRPRLGTEPLGLPLHEGQVHPEGREILGGGIVQLAGDAALLLVPQPKQAAGQLLNSPLGGFALGHVVDDEEDHVQGTFLVEHASRDHHRLAANGG